MQLEKLDIEDKIFVILRKNYYEILDELIFSGEIELGKPVTDFYEKFKYDKLFSENKTTQRLEVLILNHLVNAARRASLGVRSEYGILQKAQLYY